jgi:general stress protein 26
MRVTARAMSIINDGLNLYFQTDTRFLKARQMEENSRAAFCLANIQMEGTVINRGHSSLPENSWFCDEYSRVHYGSYTSYSHIPEERVYEFRPVLITAWRYENKQAFRDILEPQTDIYRREPYEVF